MKINNKSSGPTVGVDAADFASFVRSVEQMLKIQDRLIRRLIKASSEKVGRSRPPLRLKDLDLAAHLSNYSNVVRVDGRVLCGRKDWARRKE